MKTTSCKHTYVQHIGDLMEDNILWLMLHGSMLLHQNTTLFDLDTVCITWGIVRWWFEGSIDRQGGTRTNKMYSHPRTILTSFLDNIVVLSMQRDYGPSPYKPIIIYLVGIGKFSRCRHYTVLGKCSCLAQGALMTVLENKDLHIWHVSVS